MNTYESKSKEFQCRYTERGELMKEPIWRKNKKKKGAPTVGTGEWPTAERFKFITFLFERMLRGFFTDHNTDDTVLN